MRIDPFAEGAYHALRRFIVASAAGDDFTQWHMLTALCRVVGDIAAGAAKDDHERDAIIEFCAGMIKAQCERRKAAP